MGMESLCGREQFQAEGGDGTPPVGAQEEAARLEKPCLG